MRTFILTILMGAALSFAPSYAQAQFDSQHIPPTKSEKEVLDHQKKRMQERFDKMEKMTPEERDAYVAELYKNPSAEWDTLHADIKKAHIKDAIDTYDKMPKEVQKALKAHILSKKE